MRKLGSNLYFYLNFRYIYEFVLGFKSIIHVILEYK